MQFHDITHNQQTYYLLNKPEQQVFFLFNTSGEITFELATPGAEAHIFALFVGRDQDECNLKIHQKHTTPETTSHALVKSVLFDQARFRSEGSILLAPEAQQSASSQTIRNLLLSREAQAFSQPNLEILADDVVCHHAATTSHVSAEQSLYMRSRGLTLEQTQTLLVDGFVQDLFTEIEKLGKFPELESYKTTLP